MVASLDARPVAGAKGQWLKQYRNLNKVKKLHLKCLRSSLPDLKWRWRLAQVVQLHRSWRTWIKTQDVVRSWGRCFPLC